MQGTYVISESDREFSCLASFAVPLGVPVSRQHDSGVLRGQVYRVDRHGRHPVPGAVVRVGDVATKTDAKGRYALSGLSEGPHIVQIEQSTMDFGYLLASESSNPEVTIRAGRSTELDLEVARAGRVAGRLVLTAPEIDESQRRATLLGDGGESELRQRDLAGATLVLENGSRRLVSITDGTGYFEFPAIPPGAWLLSVPKGELPSWARPQVSELSIQVVAGSGTWMELPVLPEVRSIQLRPAGAPQAALPDGRRLP